MAGSTAEPPERRRTLGRRCELGCESWPNTSAFKVCPACGEETTIYNNLDPLDQVEAQRLKNELNFEDYYEHRCHERAIPSDGDLPDEYARARGIAYDQLPGPDLA